MHSLSVGPHRIMRAKGGRSFAKRRPLTGEGFERLLEAVKTVPPKDVDAWTELLNTRSRCPFSADARMRNIGNFSVVSTPNPARGDHDKSSASPNRRPDHQRPLPVVPEFVAWLHEVPEAQRRGKMFRAANFSPVTVGQRISAFGAEARVVVNENGKTASAHDLRRSFGTRWAKRLQPAELRELMRHRDISTTLDYYVELDAYGLAERLQAAIAAGDAR